MIRLALIDCGTSGEIYARLSKRLYGASISAVADVDEGPAQRAVDALNGTIPVSSVDELFAQMTDEFDAVVVGPAATTRNSIVERAASAGKHVLLDARAAKAAADVEAFDAASRESRIRVMIGQPSRYLPSVRTVKECVDSGNLGQPGLLHIHRWAPLNNDKQFDETLVSRIVAEIDLARWLFDDSPSEVYAVCRAVAMSGAPSPDYMQVHLGFEDGGMAMIDCAKSLPTGQGYYSLSLIGSTGAAYADDHHDMQLLYRGGPSVAVKTDLGQLHLLAQLQDFVNCIRDNRAPPATIADLRAAIEVLEAAIKSTQSGRAIHRDGGGYEFA